MKLKPLGDRLIVQAVEEEETTASGIVLPDTAKEKPQKGKVLAVGDGKVSEDTGKRIPLDVVRGRRGPLLQVRRHRDQGRRRGSARPARVRRARQGRGRPKEDPGHMAHKELKYDRGRPQGARGTASTRSPTRSRSRSARKGRYVVLDKKFGAPTITNDGVTIAREIEVEDVFQNQGAQLVREVATATNDVAGDGTTTATVLAQAIVREGLKNVAAGANPLGLKRGIEKAVDQVVEHIQQAVEGDLRQGADRPRGGHLGRRRGDRRRDRRRDRQGRQGRRGQRRGGPDVRHGPRVHRGHAVRQGLHLALHGHRPGAHGGGARGSLHPHRQPEDRLGPGPAAGPRAGRSSRASRC